MTALGDLPEVMSFFGTDLKTGSLIIAALGIVHPMAFGCSFFMPLSYLLVTIWLLVACYFAASVCLFFGLNTNDTFLIALWIWYAVIFVVVMLMMMILLALVYTSRRQRSRVLVVILGMLWYILTVYFILVVNSHRNVLLKEQNLDEKITDKKF
ncbi:PREDICTED: uncharacterized protein LOC106113598 [Papilio xuthus]|uniref:Uncharacterized protein LOC106113598 n=1 Tax=Papilio xuthus TaxID=66420 RepID=A0AAJ6YZ34_PAPXU|nr:PREDICTED: uncharacterized protein LOC106113598 [Papilio xuthus]